MIYYSGNQSTAQEREEDQQQQNDTGLSIAELKSIMGNRKEWMKLVNGAANQSAQIVADCSHIQIYGE